MHCSPAISTPRALSQFLALLLSLNLWIPASAYEYPLTAEEVREAYFFGRSSDRGKVAEFLGEYIRVFPPQDGVPFVGRIELRTPYQRVVERSWDNQSDYSAQRAEKDWAPQAAILEVRLFLHLGGGRPGPTDLYTDNNGRVLDRRENFWRDFQFRVAQEHAIQPKNVVAHPLYGRRGQGLAGAEVDLEFNASEFTSSEVQLEIVSLPGRTTKTSFALDHLK